MLAGEVAEPLGAGLLAGVIAACAVVAAGGIYFLKRKGSPQSPQR